MNKHRKEWEEKKPVCPECEKIRGIRCDNCGDSRIQPYTQYLESELEKRDARLEKITSVSTTLLVHLQKIINQSSLVIPESETRAWIKLDILIESFAKAIKGE